MTRKGGARRWFIGVLVLSAAIAMVPVAGVVEHMWSEADRIRDLGGTTPDQTNTVSPSYGANGLLPEDDREEFKNRLEPFRGLVPPPPLES